MTTHVTFADLQALVQELASGRFTSQLESGDAERIARAIHCIAETLDEKKVKIDVDAAMLRVTEARALAGFLRSKYRGRGRDATLARKKAHAVGAENVRTDLLSVGEKVTEARIATKAELDEDYLEALSHEHRLNELQDHLESIQTALEYRHEAVVEISRNERALLKTQD